MGWNYAKNFDGDTTRRDEFSTNVKIELEVISLSTTESYIKFLPV